MNFKHFAVVTRYHDIDTDKEVMVYIKDDLEWDISVGHAKVFSTREEAIPFSERAELHHGYVMEVIQIDSWRQCPLCGAEGIIKDVDPLEVLFNDEPVTMICSNAILCDSTWKVKINLHSI